MGLAKLVIGLAGGDWSKVDLIIRDRKDAKVLVNEMNNALEDFGNATSAGKFFSYMDGLETFFEDLPDDITIEYEHSIADFIADMRDRRADEIENVIMAAQKEVLWGGIFELPGVHDVFNCKVWELIWLKLSYQKREGKT